MTTFKRLTVDNWLEPDEASASFERVSLVTGQRHSVSGDDFARSILNIDVSSLTPTPVAELFRVAQGVLLYGYLFYPLYALGEEQLWRVCEAALGARFRQLSGPPGRKPFASRIAWMHEQGHFTDEQHTWWTATKDLRNAASHPELQTLSMPGEVIGDLRRTAHAISCLFDDTLDFMAAWPAPLG